MNHGAGEPIVALNKAKRPRILIDTDPGVDDAMALLLAFGSSARVTVEGLTIVCGNGKDVKQLGANAKLICRLAGFPDTPIALGEVPTDEEPPEGQEDASRPVLEFSTPQAVLVHGSDGLGDMASTFGQAASDFEGFDPRPAHEFLYDACAAAPGEITLVAIGPLTNIATALEAHPNMPELAKGLVIMGGAVLGELRGNRTPAAEANFAHDPEAAQAVLTAGFQDVIVADLGITHQTDLAVLVDRCLQGADAGSVIPRFVGGVPLSRPIWRL